MPALLVELDAQLLAGQLVAVAGEAREGRARGRRARRSARTRVAFFGSTGVADRRPDRDERERHAVDLGVLGREQVGLGVRHVGRAAQRPAHDLLAEQLRREGADAEHVRHGVRVPALGQHRDADDALDLLAEAPRLADRVHDLAQQVFVGDGVRVALGEALAVLGLELVDLARHELLELRRELLARLDLRRVDEDRVRAGRSSWPNSTLLKSLRLPGATTVFASSPSPTVCSQPAIQSKTSLETLVLLQTTMNTGGVSSAPSSGARRRRSRQSS